MMLYCVPCLRGHCQHAPDQHLGVAIVAEYIIGGWSLCAACALSDVVLSRGTGM